MKKSEIRKKNKNGNIIINLLRHINVKADIQNPFPFFLIIMLFFACGYSTEPDVCSKQTGRFIDDVHYIQGSFLTEDGRWDYRQWDRYRERISKYRPEYECIPIEYPRDLPRKLYDLEQTIDLQK